MKLAVKKFFWQMGIVQQEANQWLLSEYDDPNVTLSLSTFEAQIEIIALYENIDIDTE